MRARIGVRSGCVGALLVAAALLSGCGQSPGMQPPAGGVLTLNLAPSAPSVSGLSLSSAKIQIENLTVIGDVASGHASVSELSLDLLGATQSFTFDMLPQGVYSRVDFRVDSLQAQGTWRGVPLQIQLEPGDGSAATVDLRSSSGMELAAGHDVTFTVSVDGGSWFAGNLLDSATQSSSQIVVDQYNNTSIGSQILMRALASFTLHDSPIP